MKCILKHNIFLFTHACQVNLFLPVCFTENNYLPIWLGQGSSTPFLSPFLRQSECVFPVLKKCISSFKKIWRYKHPRALWMICKHTPQQNLWQEFSYEHKHPYVPPIIRHPVFYENYKKLETHAPDTWINELTNKLKIHVFSIEILISIMHFIYDSFGFCCCFVTFCKLISINYIIS